MKLIIDNIIKINFKHNFHYRLGLYFLLSQDAYIPYMRNMYDDILNKQSVLTKIKIESLGNLIFGAFKWNKSIECDNFWLGKNIQLNNHFRGKNIALIRPNKKLI